MSETHPACTTTSPAYYGACSPLRVLLIAGLSLGLGIATNRWLNANGEDLYSGQMRVKTLLVRAPVDGILQTWNVNEGDTVDPHAMLCQVGGHSLNRQVHLQQQEVARLEARLATLSAEVDVKLHEHLREVEGDIYQAELQTADLLQKKYYFELEAMAWRDTLKSYEETHGSVTRKEGWTTTAGEDHLTDRQINALLKEEAAVNSVEATEAQLKICGVRLEKLQKQRQAIQERVRMAVGISEVDLQLSQARDELTSLQQQLEQQNIRSPTVGTIVNFRRRPGEYIQAGEVLAELLQLNESYVEADIPSALSHRFHVNSPVKCRFPNGETRSGVVTRVAIATSPEHTGQHLRSTVPMRIEPTGALWPSMPIGGEVTILR